MKSNLHTHFKCLKDPRIDRKKLHSLQDILSLVVIGIICGADSWDTIEEFGKTKKEFLSTFLTLSNGIPSHDTLNRVFSSINPKKFEIAFISWANSLKNKDISNEVIAIDGKTLFRVSCDGMPFESVKKVDKNSFFVFPNSSIVSHESAPHKIGRAHV